MTYGFLPGGRAKAKISPITANGKAAARRSFFSNIVPTDHLITLLTLLQALRIILPE